MTQEEMRGSNWLMAMSSEDWEAQIIFLARDLLTSGAAQSCERDGAACPSVRHLKL